MPSLPAKRNILLMLEKTLEKQKLNLSLIALFYMITRGNIKYFVTVTPYFHKTPNETMKYLGQGPTSALIFRYSIGIL